MNQSPDMYLGVISYLTVGIIFGWTYLVVLKFLSPKFFRKFMGQPIYLIYFTVLWPYVLFLIISETIKEFKRKGEKDGES